MKPGCRARARRHRQSAPPARLLTLLTCAPSSAPRPGTVAVPRSIASSPPSSSPTELAWPAAAPSSPAAPAARVHLRSLRGPRRSPSRRPKASLDGAEGAARRRRSLRVEVLTARAARGGVVVAADGV